MVGEPVRQQRGLDRRAALIESGAQVLVAAGPTGFTARAVSRAAQLPLASVSYYFDSVDELLGLSAALAFAGWVDRGRRVAEDSQGSGAQAAATAITAALMPAGGRPAILSRYELILASARVPPVAAALATLRPEFEAVISLVLARTGVRSAVLPSTLLSVVDGAVVGALAEGAADPAALTTFALLDILVR